MTRRAFTLIELLVVVAVLGALIGLLLPAIGRARAAGEAAVCLSNMRQLAIAQGLYLLDYDGKLVHYGIGEGGAALDEDRSWFAALSAYYDTPLVIRSPVDDSPYWPPEEGGSGVTAGPGAGVDGHRVTSYGLNDFVSADVIVDPSSGRTSTFNRIDRIRSPSGTVQWVMMTFGYDGESFFGEFAVADHVHPSEWWFGDPDAPPFLAAQMVETNAHGGPRNTWTARANYAFLDGHALQAPFDEVYRDNTKNNFDPRVAH